MVWSYANVLEQNNFFTWEKSSIPTELFLYTNISLFCTSIQFGRRRILTPENSEKNPSSKRVKIMSWETDLWRILKKHPLTVLPFLFESCGAIWWVWGVQILPLMVSWSTNVWKKGNNEAFLTVANSYNWRLRTGGNNDQRSILLQRWGLCKFHEIHLCRWWKTSMVRSQVINGANVHDQIAFCAFHSSFTEVQRKLATYSYFEKGCR